MVVKQISDVEPRSVVDRALHIIDTFQEGRPQLTLAEISRHAGLSSATAYRIVQRLTAWGALERDEFGRYSIGLHLWEVASLAPRATGLEQVARPFMHDLYELTRCSIHLGVCQGAQVVMVDRLHSLEQDHLRTRVGGRYPLHATAMGLILLANSNGNIQREVFVNKLSRFTEHTCTNIDELRGTLIEIRHSGFAVADRTINLDCYSVAAPILASSGNVIAAVSINSRPSAMDEKSATHLVRLTASSISRAYQQQGPVTFVPRRAIA